MNRAIMILQDSLEWNNDMIKRAKKDITDGYYGPELEERERSIKEWEEHNVDITEALGILRKGK